MFRILVSKFFKQRRGKASQFTSQDRKVFAREPFCVSEIFWEGKKLWIRGEGGITFFRQKVFVSL